MAEKKNKQYVSDNAQLMTEWNWAKNEGISPHKLSFGSNQEVWWKCGKGHEWPGKVSGRTRGGRIGAGCPYCGNRKLLIGFNDLKSKYPEFAKEWNYKRNGDLRPENVLFNSTERVWWICSTCGYDDWKTAINNRTGTSHGGGCPYCTGEVVWAGHNDLQTLYPEIAAEWDYENNNGLLPNQVTAKGDKKVRWLCPACGKSYPAAIGNRTRNHSGCPDCGAKKALDSRHQNRIKTGDSIVDSFPEIAKEWDYQNNKELPENVVFGSHDEYYWKCSVCNYRWKAKVYSRTAMNTGCPRCSKSKHTSFQEQAIFFYLKQQYPDAKNSYSPSWLRPSEIDIFLPSMNLGIEYDGLKWHQNAERDQKKISFLLDRGIKMLRIREKGCPEIHHCDVIEGVQSGSHTTENELNQMIERVLAYVNRIKSSEFEVDVNIERDTSAILAQYVISENEKALSVTHPEIAKELHPTRNDNVSAERISAGCNYKLWWRCSKCGNEYPMRVCNRTYLGQGCKQCNSTLLCIKVKCVETGVIYPSISDAAAANGLKGSSSINKVLKGERNTAAGYHWTYAETFPPRRRKSHSIYCVELDRVFVNIAEAERITCIDHHTISRCLRGQTATAGGYHWIYAEK